MFAECNIFDADCASNEMKPMAAKPQRITTTPVHTWYFFEGISGPRSTKRARTALQPRIMKNADISFFYSLAISVSIGAVCSYRAAFVCVAPATSVCNR